MLQQMRRLITYILLFIVIVFLIPAVGHAIWWTQVEKPSSWRSANWSSAGILPEVSREDAALYVMAARTGGMKGAFATHSWIVIKKPGNAHYDRYDVVGWGRPVRKNAYDADGRWYSNDPEIQYSIFSEDATRLIPSVEKAISSYRWQNYGDYTIWPGPNSNTFVAAIIRAVPSFEATMPATAVGRDFPENGDWLRQTASGAYHATLGGYAGLVFGPQEGFEINFLGLVAGLNLPAREIKIPAVGAVTF